MRSQLVVPLVALIVASQVCCCCTILGGPQPPYSITPSDEAVQSFEERMDSVDRGADGTFSITLTEEEMTSLVVWGLAKQEQVPPISDPQVHFRNGRVEVYGTVTVRESMALPGMVAFSFAPAEDGIAVVVEEVSLGPLPIPDSVLQSLSEIISQVLTENMSVDGVEAVITDVQIGEGQMTLTGKPKSD